MKRLLHYLFGKPQQGNLFCGCRGSDGTNVSQPGACIVFACCRRHGSLLMLAHQADSHGLVVG